MPRLARDYVIVRIKCTTVTVTVVATFSVGVSESLRLAGTEPVGFRVKSDLRNHCAIVQPRMVLHCKWFMLPMTLDMPDEGTR